MKRLLLSCFGLGYLPVAPGTWGSLPVAVVFVLMDYFGASSAIISVVMLLIIAAASFVCVKFAPAIISATGKEDPSEVVADEVAGQAVAFLGACIGGVNSVIIAALIGFAAFRLFDIAKPWPCRSLEKLQAGVGILADDLMAGVYAAIVLQICIRLWYI